MITTTNLSAGPRQPHGLSPSDWVGVVGQMVGDAVPGQWELGPADRQESEGRLTHPGGHAPGDAAMWILAVNLSRLARSSHTENVQNVFRFMSGKRDAITTYVRSGSISCR
jgi:hypothetical protein